MLSHFFEFSVFFTFFQASAMAVWISPNVFSGFLFLISLRISSAKKKYADFACFGACGSVFFFFGFVLGMLVSDSSDESSGDLLVCAREVSESEELDEDESDDFLLSDSSSESLDEEDDLSDDEDELLDEEESDESFVLPCSLGCMVMVS